MKIKTYKIFGLKIFETIICENEKEVEQQAILKEKPTEEGGIIDYSPSDEQADIERTLRGQDL